MQSVSCAVLQPVSKEGDIAMTQVFLTPTFNEDPRIRQAGSAAVGAYVLSLTAANEDNFVFVPAEIEGEGDRETTDRLLEAGLWSRAEDGYRIHGEGELFVRELPEGATAVTATL
jgi:hypothetical protein